MQNIAKDKLLLKLESNNNAKKRFLEVCASADTALKFDEKQCNFWEFDNFIF